MSERLKEPVLKTGEAKVSVGSNPTLSAKLYMDLQKYPRGRRGSPAKGVGWIKPARGFKSLLLRHVGAKSALLRRLFMPVAKKTSSARSLAPPLQTGPAALGSGLVLGAILVACASFSAIKYTRPQGFPCGRVFSVRDSLSGGLGGPLCHQALDPGLQPVHRQVEHGKDPCQL